MNDSSEGSSDNQHKGKKGKRKGKGPSTPTSKHRNATKNYGGHQSSSSSSSSSSSGSSNWNTAKKQPVQNEDNVIRTDKGVYEFVVSKAWGEILVPVNDPSNIKVTYDEINGINLPENFPRVPSHLWARWIKLCFHFCPDKPISHHRPAYGGYGYTANTHRCWNAIEKRYEEYRWEGNKRVPCTIQPPRELRQDNGSHGDEHRPLGFAANRSHSTTGRVSESGELEVSMIFARKAPHYDEWRIFVPKQKVSGGSVDADLSELCDIETGEIFDGIPAGWAHAGSSHSHNSMGAFFSPTDDRSELGVPGMHIVVGSIDKKKSTYAYKASIVLRQLRKKLDIEEVVDTTPDEESHFHPDVLKMVTSKNYFGGSSSSSTTKTKSTSTESSKDTKEDDDWKSYWKARKGFIADEDDQEDIICSSHFLAWRKRQEQKNKAKPAKTIGGSDNSRNSNADDSDVCWTDGTDGDYDGLQLPMNEAFETPDDVGSSQEWGLDKIISQYQEQVHRTPLQDDSQWHGLKENK